MESIFEEIFEGIEADLLTEDWLQQNKAELNAIEPFTLLTPLATAIKQGKPDMVALLMDAGADINKASGRLERTPLVWAISLAKEEPENLVKFKDIYNRLLTSSIINIHSSDKFLMNALMYAVELNDRELVVALLDKQPNIYHLDANGNNVVSHLQSAEVTELFKPFFNSSRSAAP